MSLRRWHAVAAHRRLRSPARLDHPHPPAFAYRPSTPDLPPYFSIGGSTGLMLPHLVSHRLISTGSLSLTRSSLLQVRQISFISAAARAAGRVGGRLVGVGAVGVGSAAYVGSQVDG